MRRSGSNTWYWQWRAPRREDFGVLGLVVRFIVNVAALWLSQFIVPGFDIESLPALLFGAVLFGLINAFIKPIVAFFSCLLTLATLGLFTLIINTLMLWVTEWHAGLFGLDFHVDGFWAAFFGALIISVVSTILSRWADDKVLRPSRRNPPGDAW